jgi:hypothetical protein
MNNQTTTDRRQSAIVWAVIVSEISHIFCCVLPTIFTVMSLMTNLGMISTMPVWFAGIHTVMHAWEFPIVVASGLTLAIGWVLHYLSLKEPCETAGCTKPHVPCAPRKNKMKIFLIVATVLFAVNVFVFLVIHRGMGVGNEAIKTEAMNHDHAHDH